jgi:nucleotidyltransferase substrate binding protein (TIGR01987 family)
METTPPVAAERWKQRFENFNKAFSQLQLAVTTYQADKKNELIAIAVIKTFEMTYELAWKTLKDYLNYNGVEVKLPRDVLKQAFANNLVADGQVWIEMLDDRNVMTHTYDNEKALLAIQHICTAYLPAITALQAFFNQKASL